jgi:hypothetical protein
MSEYRFDRYRNGRKMAEGLVLTKPTSIEQAVAIAARLAQVGDIFVLRQDSRIAELEAERDAAKAGEARAVEALKQGRVLAQKVVGETWDLAGSFTDKEQALFDWVEDLDWPRYPTPALAWLAQREREAVVRELEQLMESEWKWEEFELKASIYARIADLRDEQPTACPRSEVRGEENNNA